MEPAATEALDAITERDWERLKPLLHPYLHWETPEGVLRGRTKVLALLGTSDPPPPPSAVELRDDQIYRWHR